MPSDRGPAATGPQTTPTYEAPETLALDAELRRLAVDLAAVDRETNRYRRKLAGLEPWTDLEALIPASVRNAS
jgi:hypothetical protein